MTLASHHLEAFLAVANNGHFTKAAESLNVTQSALSQRILNLEGELGTTLFIRDRAGVKLTETAQKLLRYCQTKNALEADFISGLHSSEELAGIIRIGGFSSVLRSVALPALSPLLKKHSSLSIEMVTREMSDLLPLLKNGAVDFIITDQNFDREEIESIKLGDEVNVLVEKKDYNGPEIYLDHDPKDDVTIRYLKLNGTKAQALRRRYLDDVYGLWDGVRLGMGRAVLPRHLVGKDRALTILNPGKSFVIPVYLNFYRQPFYSRLHKACIQELTENCRDILKG